MTARDLLHDLEVRGVRVTLDGEYLHVRAPADAVTEELRATLAERKADILAALRNAPPWRRDLDAWPAEWREAWTVYREHFLAAGFHPRAAEWLAADTLAPLLRGDTQTGGAKCERPPRN